MNERGNPRCWYCHGKGGSMSHGRWHACVCVQPRRSVAAMLRKAHEQAGRPFRLPGKD